MSHQRLHAQRDQLEDEIRRLEASLKKRCDELSTTSRSNIDEDLEMIKRMREILSALRREHAEVVSSLDRALATASRPHEQPPYTREAQHATLPIALTSSADLDSLVRRVQAAIGEDQPQSPELKRYIQSYGHASTYTAKPHEHAPPCAGRSYEPSSPGEADDSLNYSELSVASQQYMHKYGLLPASPTPRHRPQHRQAFKPVNPSRLGYGHAQDGHSPSYHPSKAKRTGVPEGDRILDIENLRLLPKF